MPSKHGSLVVIGSGPGIGRNVAALFAERGFSQVILMSRDETRLKEDAAFVTSSAPSASVEIVRIDLADTDSVATALQEVDRKLERSVLECVIFNAARIGISPILEFGAEELERDLKVCSSLMVGRRMFDDSLDLRRKHVQMCSMGTPPTAQTQRHPFGFFPRHKWTTVQGSFSSDVLARDL